MEQWDTKHLALGLKAVLAPNPSPMTSPGTLTYLIGAGKDVALIDPGPVIPEHQAATLRALAPGQSVSAILVTHAHRDHSPAAVPLSAMTGAPVYAFGRAEVGRSDVMRRLAQIAPIGGGEGVDSDFAPDVLLRTGDNVAGDGWTFWRIGRLAIWAIIWRLNGKRAGRCLQATWSWDGPRH